MTTQNIKATILAVAVTAIAGLTACDTGTSPGETNVERSEIREEGSIIDADDGAAGNNSDTTDMERYYDQTDEGSAVHAGDGQGNGVGRDEVDNH